MKTDTKISDETKQRIIELFICSDDRRLWVIAEITNVTVPSVSTVIQQYYDGIIQFNRGNFKVLHSSINNF